MSGFAAIVYNKYIIVNNNYITYKWRSNDKCILGGISLERLNNHTSKCKHTVHMNVMNVHMCKTRLYF